MASFQVFLFGVPSCERDGEAVAIQRRKAWALLAYLLVTGRPHSRDSLATLFFPEYDQSGALANLRRMLFEVRSVLGQASMTVDRMQVAVNPDAQIWLDVREFQTRLVRVQQHAHETLCADCLNDLKQAVELYRGDFMAGFSLPDCPAFDEWQFFQGESLRQALATGLQSLIQWHRDGGEFEGGITYARRWLSLDPLHEPAHRCLMELYAGSGQHSAAIRQYQECVRLLKEELGVEPEEETTALYRAIRTREFVLPGVTGDSQISGDSVKKLPYEGQKEAPAPSNPNNLPAPSTPFVGRENELAQIEDILIHDPGCRLVTLVGLGGAGKTRLALQAAAAALSAFPDGVFFVPLAPLTSADYMAEALAGQLRFSFHESASAEQQLLDFLRPKEMLLILDNFEHLLPATDLVMEILKTAPKIKILATSRARLNLKDETIFNLGGLAYPSDKEGKDGLSFAANLPEYEAVRMLVQSARRVRPGFELQPPDFEPALHICQLVEGMPLAIELAAGWLELLSLAEIAVEISRSLDFLESQAFDLPSRQRSIRAVFDYSWSILDSNERAALQQMAVFQGSFTRQAAQVVAQASLTTLLSLMHKSLLQRGEDGRYQIHELLRQFALEKLQADPPAWHRARDQHGEYYATLLCDLADAMRGPKQGEAFATVAAEFENIRLAWGWLVDQKQFDTLVHRLLPAVFLYCEARSRASEMLGLVKMALQALESAGELDDFSLLKGILLTAWASFSRIAAAFRFIAFDLLVLPYEDVIAEALSLVSTPQVLGEIGFWGPQLLFVYGRAIDYDKGREFLLPLVQYFRQKDQPWELAFTLEMLGCVDLVITLYGDEKGPSIEEAGQSLTEALAIFQQLGDEREAVYTQRLLGNYHGHRQHWAEAIANWKAAQAKFKAMGDWTVARDIDQTLGDLYLRLGDFETAFQYYREMSQTSLKMGHKRWAAYALSKESYEALRYSTIDHARQTREWSLALNREVQDVFGEGWGAWEMGEVFRVAGDLAAARQWYEGAKLLFADFQESNGIIFYHRGLGDLALANRDYDGAQEQFQQSLELARKAGFKWGATYALAGLGKAAIELGQFEAAQEYLAESLRLAMTTMDSSLAGVVLLAYARHFAATGEVEQVVEICALIAEHKIIWNETKAQAAALQAGVQDLSPERLAEAYDRGRKADVWEMVDRLLGVS